MPDVETGFAQVPRAQLYYEVAGRGHPLLLIHAGVADRRMWDEQFPVFAEHFRTVRYDTRAFGKSVTEDVSFSNRQDVLDLLDHLGIRRTYIMGVSRGGSIAIDFTLEHAERVATLIAVASGLGGFKSGPRPDAETRMFAEMDRLYEAKDFARLADLEVRMWAYAHHGKACGVYKPGPGVPARSARVKFLPHLRALNVTDPSSATVTSSWGWSAAIRRLRASFARCTFRT